MTKNECFRGNVTLTPKNTTGGLLCANLTDSLESVLNALHQSDERTIRVGFRIIGLGGILLSIAKSNFKNTSESGRGSIQFRNILNKVHGDSTVCHDLNISITTLRGKKDRREETTEALVTGRISALGSEHTCW